MSEHGFDWLIVTALVVTVVAMLLSFGQFARSNATRGQCLAAGFDGGGWTVLRGDHCITYHALGGSR